VNEPGEGATQLHNKSASIFLNKLSFYLAFYSMMQKQLKLEVITLHRVQITIIINENWKNSIGKFNY
jgi:hypothetical protein